MLLNPGLEVRYIVPDLQALRPAAQVFTQQQLIQAVRADVVEQLKGKH